MTIRVTLNCSLKAGITDQLKPFLQQKVPLVRNFSGCESSSIYFNQSADEMLIEEQWESIEMHQKYIQHIEKNGVLQQLASFFSAPPKIKYFTKDSV
ncbi:MAG: hypothetical protein MJK13_07920 [Pseudomonadales bacterium]|nr:hypothetical protein [Pseudomonadales bacterium]